MPIFAYIYPLLVMTTLFVGNSILFAVPKGNGNAFACFAVSELIADGKTIDLDAWLDAKAFNR